MENQLLLALKNNKLLNNVDSSELNLQNIKGNLVTINEGEILYREGEAANSLFLIVSGEINLVRKKILGKTRSIILTENDFVGNDEFFDETARTSTAVALKDSYMIQLSEEEVHDLVQQDTGIYANLTEPLPGDADDVISAGQQPPVDDLPEEEPAPEQTEPAPAETEETIVEEESPSPVEEDDINIETDNDLILDENIPEETTPEIIPEPGNLEEEIFQALNNEPEQSVEEPVIENELNEDTFKALESLEEPVQETTGLPDDTNNETTELSEEDVSFFAGMSEKDETKTEHVEPEPILEEEQPETIPEETPENISFNDDLTLPDDIFEEDETKTEDEVKPEPEVTSDSMPAEEDTEISDIVDVAAPVEEVETPQETAPDIADKRKQLEDEVMTSEQLEMINKAAQLVNSNIKIDDVLNTIVDVASNLTKADRGTLYLLDKQTNELWSKVAMGNEMKEIRVKVGVGISGWVAESGEIVNIKDVKTDERFSSDYDKSSGYDTKNMMCFPIKNKKEEVIGVLQLLNSANGEFSDMDQEFLNALSIHAALALENASLVEKLLHGERVSSLGKMANFLIQDIKKPILVSKRYAEHLKTKELPPQIMQVLDMMLEQLNQVADLVQTTSSYSEGKRILHTLTVNFMEIMEDFSQRMASYVQTKNCEIINNVDANINLKMDVKEFYQCYMHIVRNACDAMPDGGRIVVFSDLKEKQLTLSFKDDGLGIPDTIKDKVFEPFTSHGKKEGTGLGLSITKQIVEAHGGEISIESALGAGTTVSITLLVNV